MYNRQHAQWSKIWKKVLWGEVALLVFLKAKICCNIFLFLNLCVHLNVVFSKIYAPVISVFFTVLEKRAMVPRFLCSWNGSLGRYLIQHHSIQGYTKFLPYKICDQQDLYSTWKQIMWNKDFICVCVWN